MNQPTRTIPNPWPRMAMACVLTVWAGANLWSCVFRRQEILSPDYANKTIGLFLGILFTLLPLVVAIYLFWSIVIEPEDTPTPKKRRR